MPRYELLHLNESQHEELTKWAHSRTLPAGEVFRAKLILSLANGMTYEQVVSALGTTKPRSTAKKLHHYVPRFYLRAWAENEKIFCLHT